MSPVARSKLRRRRPSRTDCDLSSNRSRNLVNEYRPEVVAIESVFMAQERIERPEAGPRAIGGDLCDFRCRTSNSSSMRHAKSSRPSSAAGRRARNRSFTWSVRFCNSVAIRRRMPRMPSRSRSATPTSGACRRRLADNAWHSRRQDDRIAARQASGPSRRRSSSSNAAASATKSKRRCRRFSNCRRSARKSSFAHHLVVRDDAHTLYGFATEDEKALFRLLLKVSGVGAKMGLAILSGMTSRTSNAACVTRTLPMLVKIPGIGKKTAERLIIEMRDRIEASLRG